ncbi:MAG: glycosyltransferase family 39 protein [Candidatus Omnitrophica bacterium]|nr:glycosyltransferase family 39 protein [Candidatus Omnitrophota bacterium]
MRNILKFGLPQAYDGKNTVLILEIPEFSKNYLFGKYWMGQPWLAIYMASLSFRVFGISTRAARFPFALTGLFSVLLVYLLAQKFFKSRTVSNLSASLATFSVPFILHLRQCRYYSPGVFLTLLCIYLYLCYIEKRKFSSPFLLASLFLLLNTSLSYFLGVAAAIIIHMFFSRTSPFFKRNIVFLVVLSLFSIPILYLFKLQRRLALDFDWISHNVRFYIRAINKYIFPWRSAILLYVFYVLKKRKFTIPMPKKDREAAYLLSLFIVSALPFLLIINMNSLRYIIHIAPLFFILEAYIIYRLMARFKYLALCVIIPLAIFTNAFSFSLPVRSFFLDYIYEITHDYDGPAEGITGYLNANAKPGDTVKVAHRFDNPIIFYTDLKVDNMPPFDDGKFPEWIVVNGRWNSGFYDSDFYLEVKKRYEEIVLPYPDIPWENRPDDMGYHKFKTDASAPMVKIYKRR